MRPLPLILVIAAACSKPKPENSRFLVDVESLGNVKITVAGHEIPLTPKKLEPSWSEGMVDFKEKDVPAKTVPEVMAMTPCGPKKVTLKEFDIWPPNESNVVVMKIYKSTLPKQTTLIFAPGVEGPVTIGDITVPTPLPKTFDVFDAGCGKPIKIGSQEATIEAGVAAIVVAGPSKCVRTGVALYGTGSGCQPESAETLEGKLVYPLKSVPYLLFAGLSDSMKSTSNCTNMTWLQECR